MKAILKFHVFKGKLLSKTDIWIQREIINCHLPNKEMV